MGLGWAQTRGQQSIAPASRRASNAGAGGRGAGATACAVVEVALTAGARRSGGIHQGGQSGVAAPAAGLAAIVVNRHEVCAPQGSGAPLQRDLVAGLLRRCARARGGSTARMNRDLVLVYQACSRTPKFSVHLASNTTNVEVRPCPRPEASEGAHYMLHVPADVAPLEETDDHHRAGSREDASGSRDTDGSPLCGGLPGDGARRVQAGLPRFRGRPGPGRAPRHRVP